MGWRSRGVRSQGRRAQGRRAQEQPPVAGPRRRALFWRRRHSRGPPGSRSRIVRPYARDLPASAPTVAAQSGERGGFSDGRSDHPAPRGCGGDRRLRALRAAGRHGRGADPYPVRRAERRAVRRRGGRPPGRLPAPARPRPPPPAAPDQLPGQPLGAALARRPPGARALRGGRAAARVRTGDAAGAGPVRGPDQWPGADLLRRTAAAGRFGARGGARVDGGPVLPAGAPGHALGGGRRPPGSPWTAAPWW